MACRIYFLMAVFSSTLLGLCYGPSFAIFLTVSTNRSSESSQPSSRAACSNFSDCEASTGVGRLLLMVSRPSSDVRRAQLKDERLFGRVRSLLTIRSNPRTKHSILYHCGRLPPHK